MSTELKVGFVGLGVMGRPMALNLVKAGYAVTVFDLNPAAVSLLEQAGAQTAKTVAEVAAGSDIFITMVVNDVQFKSVLFDPGLAAHSLKPGATVIGMSTMSRATVIEVARELTEMGIDYVDAPVSGGEVGAIAAELSIMVGASQAVFDRCKPLLEVMGKRLYHVGQNIGDGQAVKMINQLMVCVHLLSAAEGLNFAAKLGLDQHMVFDILLNSAGGSWILGNRGPRMVDHAFTTVKSAFHILIKDLGYVMDAADDLKHPLVLGSAANQLFKMAHTTGLRDLDDSAMLLLVEKLTGMTKPE